VEEVVVVGGSLWLQSRLRAMGQAALDVVQQRMEHAGLAVKIIGKISWGKYRAIRRILSFDFE
jgi:hypothetical protein